MQNQALTIVLCLDHAFVSGGQAKVAFDSATGLKRAGMRPIIFAAAGPIAESLQAEGIETICLGQTDLLGNPSRAKAAMQGIWNAEAANALGALLVRLPKDNTLVHVHGWAKALSPSIAMPIAASGLPALYTIHEYFLFCPNGGFYNYQKSHVCHLRPLSAQCWATHCDARTYPRKIWRSARLSLARNFAHLPEIFSDFITISDFQAQIVAPYVPKDAKLHRLSNPIPMQDFGPRPVAHPEYRVGDFLFVGRLSTEKGPFLFAEAATRLGLTPVFAGDGPVAAELAAKYPQARILGWKKPEDVRDLMRAARALVFPSLWYEGQPLTILEAKALGVPIIVADTCAGRDEVEDGVTGLWFKGGDVDDLACAMAKLRDDALVAQYSKAAHAAYWAKPSTVERHVEGLLAIYREMLGRGQGPKGPAPALNTAEASA